MCKSSVSDRFSISYYGKVCPIDTKGKRPGVCSRSDPALDTTFFPYLFSIKKKFRKKFMIRNETDPDQKHWLYSTSQTTFSSSVADPFHFYMDPDPRIRFVK